MPLGIITFIFIKCIFFKDISVDKHGLGHRMSCNFCMTLHGKMHLAQSQFQKGTRVRHAATELQINPDILAVEIKSQNFSSIYMTPLLLVVLNKVDSSRNGIFLFPHNVRTGSLEYCTSQTIKYASEQMRAIQMNDSYSLARLCVSSTPINKTEFFSKLWIMFHSETRKYWAGFVSALQQNRWIIWYTITLAVQWMCLEY